MNDFIRICAKIETLRSDMRFQPLTFVTYAQPGRSRRAQNRRAPPDEIELDDEPPTVRLRQNLANDAAVDIGEPEIATVMRIGQALVVDAQ